MYIFKIRSTPGVQGFLEIKDSHCLYRGTSLARKCTPLGPYRRPLAGVLGGSWGGGHFVIGEISLYAGCIQNLTDLKPSCKIRTHRIIRQPRTTSVAKALRAGSAGRAELAARVVPLGFQVCAGRWPSKHHASVENLQVL